MRPEDLTPGQREKLMALLAPARDEALTLAARAVYAVLLTKDPAKDSCSIEAITPEVPDGRKAVGNGLRQLRESGYLEYSRRHEGGRWVYEWRLNPHPQRHAHVA